MQKRAALATDKSSEKPPTLEPAVPTSAARSEAKKVAGPTHASKFQRAGLSLHDAKPLSIASADDELRKLLKEKYNAALATMKLYQSWYDQGRIPPFGDLLAVARRLRDAELALSEKSADEIVALDRYLKFTSDLETLAQNKLAEGIESGVTPVEAAQVHEGRLDAEIKLLQARRKPQVDSDRSNESIQSLEANVRIAAAEVAALAAIDLNTAEIERLKAELEHRRVEMARIQKLLEQKAIDEGPVNEGRKNFDVAAATLEATEAFARAVHAQLTAKKARLNAEIRLLEARRKSQSDSDWAKASIQALETIVQIAKAEADESQAAADQNKADIKRDTAFLEFRRVEMARIKKLFKQKAIDEGPVKESRKNFYMAAETLEATQAAASAHQAQLAAKKARLEQAKNDLAGTTSGRLPQRQPKSP